LIIKIGKSDRLLKNVLVAIEVLYEFKHSFDTIPNTKGPFMKAKKRKARKARKRDAANDKVM
jgi:hypothetical protein